jgi:hypothetical protein
MRSCRPSNPVPRLLRLRPFFLAAAILTVLAAARPGPVGAQPEGISYTLTPTVNALRWDNDLGLEDTELYGGRLGIDFGRLVALQGYYTQRDNVDTRLGSIPLRDASGHVLLDQRIDLSNYGADLILNLGTGNVVPYLKGEGGILRLDPDHGPDVRAINVKGGGGVRFGINRLQADLYVEDSAFRIDRYDLASAVGGPYPGDPERDDVRHNLSFGGGLTFFLGGYRGDRLSETDRAVMERYRHGLSGFSLPVEPFVGKLDFNDKLALENQDFVGVRTGIDFGRYFGLRGYYWRGVSDQFDTFQPIQSWGGEARFNLNSGRGAIPFLVGGVGQLDFRSEYRDQNGDPRSDRTMLIVGGGLDFTLSDRLVLALSGRDYILSDVNLEKTSQPEDLFSNWALSASFRFSLGGSSPSGQRPLLGGKPETAAPAAPRGAGEPSPEASAEAGAAPEEPARAEPAPAPPAMAAVPEPAEAPAGTAATAQAGAGAAAAGPPPQQPAPPARGYAGERMVTIPVPTEGEIYIRYGTPGGVSIESQNVSGAGAPTATPAPEAKAAAPAPTLDREAIREAVRQELTAAGVGAGTDSLENERLRAMEERLDRRFQERLREALEAQPATGREMVIGRSPQTGTTVVETAPGEEYRWRFRGFRPYMGWNVDHPGQAVFGGRVNLGGITPTSRFQFEPELALGFGSGETSYLLTANAHWDIAQLGKENPWTPYLSAGAGIFTISNGDTDTDLVLNLAYGVSRQFGPVVGFAEHQGIELFKYNRILVGLRLLEQE